MASQGEHRRFTITDYERMATVGILTEDDRVELIGGEIFKMSPIGGRHVQCVNCLTELLGRNVRPGALVRVQNPIRLPPDGEPQPDLAVIHDRDYGGLLPIIAEAWLVDLVSETVERHTQPRARSYRVVTYAHPGESLASTVIPSLTIPVDTILN